MKIFDGKLSEALVHQVQFTFRCHCFEPVEEKKTNMFNNLVNIMGAILKGQFTP